MGANMVVNKITLSFTLNHNWKWEWLEDLLEFVAEVFVILMSCHLTINCEEMLADDDDDDGFIR